jgi:cellulose synthase/poly-beta-1,6-N-acetylglucosamine synthase-like glycosyltransferase
VVDGASTDGTRAVLDRYGDRVSWISRPDRGPFDAISEGWEMTKGEVVTWLNADDRWEPGAVSAAVRAFLAHPEVAVVYGDARGVDDRGRERYFFPSREFEIERAALDCDHVIMQAASFVRRTAVDAAGGLVPSWTHDHELWLRVSLAGGRFLPVHELMASVRVGPGNQHNNPAVMLPARLAMTRRVFASPDLPASLLGQERRALSNTWLRGIELLQTRVPGHWWWGVRCLAGALVTDPANAAHITRRIARLVRARVHSPGGRGSAVRLRQAVTGAASRGRRA